MRSGGDIKLPDRRKYSGDKKIGDFWAFNDTLINEIGIPMLARALKTGNPSAIIGYEPRIDNSDGYNHRITFRFLKDYDFITSWYYPYIGMPITHKASPEKVNKAGIIMLLQLLRATRWSGKPVFMEQIGVSSRPGFESHQEEFLKLATNQLLDSGCMGYSIWAFQDFIHNFIYNSSFEIWPGRWYGGSLPKRLNDSNNARSGRYFLMFLDGDQISQRLYNIPTRAKFSVACLSNVKGSIVNIYFEYYKGNEFVESCTHSISSIQKNMKIMNLIYLFLNT